MIAHDWLRVALARISWEVRRNLLLCRQVFELWRFKFRRVVEGYRRHKKRRLAELLNGEVS